MTNLIISLICLLVALLGVVLKKTYFFIPTHELKRRAENSDPAATKLYKVAVYGPSLRALLWLVIGLGSAASFLLLAKLAPLWLSILIVGILIYLIFSFIPNGRVTKFGLLLAKLASPILSWLLYHTHTLLSLHVVATSKRKPSNHTGVFEADDLFKLLEHQKTQTDNRLSEQELDQLRKALLFSNKKVSDVLTPKKKVKTILASDTISPILINELYESKQDQVLVKDKKGGEVIGTLAFKSLGIHSHGQVSDYIEAKINYLHEKDPLTEAVEAFNKTRGTTFVVINNSGDFIGIITIENILHELLGDVQAHDFENYQNPEAVIARHNKPKKEIEPTEEPEETPVKTDEEVLELQTKNDENPN